MIPVFQRALKLENEDVCFRYMEYTSDNDQKTTVRWLNANYSLTTQGCDPDGILIVFPSSVIFKIPFQSISTCEIEGFLIAQFLVNKNTLQVALQSPLMLLKNDGNYTNRKRYWFALVNSFLIYWKSKEEKQSKGVISLEYYTARLQTTRDDSNTNQVSLIIKRYHPGPGKAAQELILMAEKQKKCCF